LQNEMTYPLSVLKHEHRVIERVLRALEGVCTRLEWGQPVPAEVLSQLVDFISTYADRHHHGKEETYLFPVLQRQGIPRDGGPLGVIEQEHRIESELTAEMRLSAEAYRSVDPAARQQFIEAARRYTDHLLSHIDKEDAILLRLAEEILDEDDKTSLSEGFKRAEAEFGADTYEKYDRVASGLERSWAV
jgi:hemerythrin-like domain-containing protein